MFSKAGINSGAQMLPAGGALNTARLQRPALSCLASRTKKPVRPAKIEQILPAGLLRTEAPLKFHKRPRIILFHGHEHYRLGLPESNGYPVEIDCRWDFGRLRG
jgi:hypothetical protein